MNNEELKKKLTKPQKIKLIVLLNVVGILVIASAVLLVISWSSNEERYAILPKPPLFRDTDRTFSPPTTLLIPSIGLESEIKDVGITAKGNMAVPKDFDVVGWLREGPEPGSKGNAVIAGHLDTGRGKPAVFFHLQDIKIGDEVFVINEAGEKLKFIVQGMKLVDYENPPPEVLNEIFGASDSPHLNLITCDGTWIQEKRTYSNRLIVFTDFNEVVSFSSSSH